MLEGKSAIITGATRGIGRAIADTLGKKRMRIALLARSHKRLLETAGSIKKAGGEGYVFPCDMANSESIDDVVHDVQSRLGTIDVLINNAGTFLDKPIDKITLSEWQNLLNINLTAPFLLFHHLLPIMKKQGDGKIINIASKASTQGYAGQAAYAASKHGLLGLARCLAIEARAHNIHVYTICPGAVETELIAGTSLSKRLQGKNMIKVDNIANLVVFLLNQPKNIEIPEIIINRFSPD